MESRSLVMWPFQQWQPSSMFLDESYHMPIVNNSPLSIRRSCDETPLSEEFGYECLSSFFSGWLKLCLHYSLLVLGLGVLALIPL